MFNHGSWFDDGFSFEGSTNSVEDVAFALSSGSHCSCFLISRQAFQDTGRFQFAFKKMHAVPEWCLFPLTQMLRTTCRSPTFAHLSCESLAHGDSQLAIQSLMQWVLSISRFPRNFPRDLRRFLMIPVSPCLADNWINLWYTDRFHNDSHVGWLSQDIF